MGWLFVVFVRLRISLYWLFPLSVVHVGLICLLSAVCRLLRLVLWIVQGEITGRETRGVREIIEKVAVAMAVIVGFRTLGYARLPALLEPGTVLLSGLHHVSK